MTATEKRCPNCGEMLSGDAIAAGRCSVCGRALPEDLFRVSPEGGPSRETEQEPERNNPAATAALVAGIFAVVLAVLSVLLFAPFIRESALEMTQWEEGGDLTPLLKKAKNNPGGLVVPTVMAGVAVICTLTALLLGLTALFIREAARARAIVGLALAVLTPALFWALVRMIWHSALTATEI